uniref:Reverse transcriptase domain-containing protein n=1 Tax=Caenorhabditis japonica TaxID=281687 RepID=A0A8R1IF10_CAEJA
MVAVSILMSSFSSFLRFVQVETMKNQFRRQNNPRVQILRKFPKPGPTAFPSKYLQSGKVPEKWKTSNTTLIFKKGDKEDLENYRPICLLPVLYKAFTKCVLNRIRTTLEEAQLVEQAGFRRSFSTIDHIHSIQRLLEVGREYQQPLTLVFIDFQKAFDSVEPQAIWESLKSQGVQPAYIALLQQCYTNCTTTITPFHKKIEIPITRGVRQGDPISPNLFSACLESVFNKTSCQHLRGDEDDENDKAKLLPEYDQWPNLTHLRFATTSF